MSDSDRLSMLKQLGVDYVWSPNPAAFPSDRLFDFTRFGTVAVEGTKFRLIKIDKSEK